jgi:hypothetical protein
MNNHFGNSLQTLEPCDVYGSLATQPSKDKAA